MTKQIQQMTVSELREELHKTEMCLTAIFEEAKESSDPVLNAAYYDFQNTANRIRNRLWSLEVNCA